MDLVKKILKELLPEVKIDEDKKEVVIKRNWIGSNATEAFYTLKGYSVKYSPNSL